MEVRYRPTLIKMKYAPTKIKYAPIKMRHSPIEMRYAPIKMGEKKKSKFILKLFFFFQISKYNRAFSCKNHHTIPL